MGGGRISSRMNFRSLIFPLQNFFRPLREYFLGLLGLIAKYLAHQISYLKKTAPQSHGRVKSCRITFKNLKWVKRELLESMSSKQRVYKTMCAHDSRSTQKIFPCTNIFYSSVTRPSSLLPLITSDFVTSVSCKDPH